MEQSASFEIAPGNAAATTAVNPLVDCLLRGGHPKEIKTLLTSTPGIANSRDSNGYPVLLYVFKRASYLPTGGPVRNTRALRMLMRDGGADPNVLVQGKPLLIIFCEHGATKNINLLLDYKADPNARCTVTGNTPLLALTSSKFISTAYIGISMLLKAGANYKLTNTNGDDGIDGAVTALRFAELVQRAPIQRDEIPQNRLATLLKKMCSARVHAEQDVKLAISFLETNNILKFLETLLGLSTLQTVLPNVVLEFLGRFERVAGSSAEAIGKLIVPSSGQPLLHALVERGVNPSLINHFMAWFQSEGVDIMQPCPNTGRTLFDISKNSVAISQSASQTRFGILLQSDPTLLEKDRPIFEDNRTHYIVSEHTHRLKIQERLQHVQTGSFPLKAFLSDLPYDILSEIVRHCSIRDLFALAVSCSSLNRFASVDKMVWRKLADTAMPHRSRIMVAQGHDTSRTDWRYVVQGTYHRTRHFLGKSLSPRILNLDPSISPFHVTCSPSPPKDRFLLRTYDSVNLLDTSRSCQESAKIISSWSFQGFLLTWEALLDEETIIVGCGDFHSRQSLVEKISVLKSGSEKATQFSINVDKRHSQLSAALSCDKRRIVLFPDTIIDLEHQCVIAKLKLEKEVTSHYSTGNVAASPFNSNIFLSLSDKLRVLDIRLPSVNGRVEPAQTLEIPSLSYFNGGTVHMKDETAVWIGYDFLFRADLRHEMVQTYSPFGQISRTHSNNTLVDPVECRAISFSHCVGPPLLGFSDLSGEEWTHSIHSGTVGTLAIRSSLNPTQLVCLLENASHTPQLCVYDL